MNVESILTAVIAGVITGYLGVLLALKQFREQRAFDRQLEWYERTIRALGRISTLNREMNLIAKLPAPDEWWKAWQELQKGLADMEQCINEAVLYAEQQSYEQLKTMGAKYDEIRKKGQEAAVEESAAEVLRDTLIELSKPVRKMLGLKKIRLEKNSAASER